MFLKSVAFLPAFLATVHALNDWSVPCFNGECTYDLPAHRGGAVGSLKIWGANKNAITDITPASGWVILGCDPNALQQNVRIVCQADESDHQSCGNLFRELGKSGKIVRLPETCGKNAFGRLSKTWVDADQSIPASIASKLNRRAGQSPVVRGVAIDTDFKALDVSETGPVNITIEGSTFPGAQGATARRAARSVLFDKLVEKRGFFTWIEDAFGDFNTFNLSDSTDITAVSVDKTYNLFNYGLSCPAGNGWPAYSASAKADLRATTNAVATIGVAAVGTIVPPDLTEFGMFTALNADLNGQFTLVASASGTADTGIKTLYSVGLPGLDWPGILTLGPTFKINGQALATVDVDVNLNVDLAYTLTNAKLFFPKSSTLSSGVGVSPGSSALALSVNPSLASRTYVEAHIQPRIEVGIDAIAGAATATVFLNVDAHADATLSLDAAAVITPREETANVEVDSRAVTARVTGCVDVNAGLNIYAGADASFFSLFDKSTSVTLYNKSWDIYAQCWGTSTRRSEIEPLLEARELVPRALACPSTNVDTLVKLV
ncbi:hypothetical protein P691DRAFT_773101 [Macrolepiota fuliginosa MF-IS2]|uniref:DUF7223 domain-containing protein n=1 Tax=Macrolepiota fuliginosa MF-IS2 TaxID=1400762 RepID=A0A9P6C456_9AGAR|nr:hypothetical protein P691DRAFT_773101 [Macrolepiota fuliginosa MF-IS2]